MVVVCVCVGGAEYYPHPIMISIRTLTTLMDIKIVCDMVIMCMCAVGLDYEEQ